MIFPQKRSSTDIDNDDGEVDKATYDASKFIEYPGFNAVIPPKFFDVRLFCFFFRSNFRLENEFLSVLFLQEGDYYRVPPMQFCNSKAGLTELLQDNLANPYKRRKRIKLDDTEQLSSTPSQDDDDMELQNSDDDDEPAVGPMLMAASKPILSSSNLDATNPNILPEDASSESIQLSLLELKQKQEEILRALENESSDSNSNPSPVNQDETPADDKDNNATIEITADNEEQSVETASTDVVKTNEPNEIQNQIDDNDAVESKMDTTCPESTEVTENRTNQLENVQGTPSSSMAGQSKLAMFGTPLIQQVSPYSKLPVGDKWSVGVTDVIDFENLPDATGTYSKLTGVLGKVRSVIKRIQDDEHEQS